jgi:hypothetical protein
MVLFFYTTKVGQFGFGQFVEELKLVCWRGHSTLFFGKSTFMKKFDANKNWCCEIQKKL